MPAELIIIFVVLLVIMVVAVVSMVWAMRGLATRAEVKAMESEFENKFRDERSVARIAQGNLHKRIDDISTAVNKTSAGVDILLADRSKK